MWMRLFLFKNVINFLLVYLSSADWTSFFFGDIVTHHSAVRIFFCSARHKPISVNTNHVESVEAMIDPDQVNSVCEVLSDVFLFHEIVKTNCACPFHCVIVLCQNFSHFLMQIIKDAGLIFILTSRGYQNFDSIKKMSVNNFSNFFSLNIDALKILKGVKF